MDRLKSAIIKTFASTTFNRFIAVCIELGITDISHSFYVSYSELLTELVKEGCLECGVGYYMVTTKGLLLYG
jgi:hypothetical protein